MLLALSGDVSGRTDTNTTAKNATAITKILETKSRRKPTQRVTDKNKNQAAEKMV